MKFGEWLKSRMLGEMMGSVGAIVSCKDLNNKNFKIQGALSDLRCGRRRRRGNGRKQ